VKGHLPGQIKVYDELQAIQIALSKTSKRIFPTTYSSISHCMRKLRQNTARKLQNPKIMEFTFKSFRHWGGTWLAHITGGNVLAVKKALRHKRV
jgi:integrase